MSWIGYPGTTGLSAIDYYIGDRHYLPPGKFDDIFVEKILRLPATAPFSFSQKLPNTNPLPALDNGYITFGSFNRLDKISKEVVGLWSKLLIAIPESKILIAGLPIIGNSNQLIDWFDSFGITSDRITLHHRSDMHNYLLLHHKIDVCLDTFPYCGSTTTCHALSMGVPTITLAGDMPTSASGYAILSQLGLSDFFAAHDHADFLKKGIWCSQQLSELAELRSTMRSRFTQSNLMKPDVIVRGLEFGMRHAWQRWCENLPPESFEVVQSDDDFQIVHQ
jgi:predicted O-linked N-acetylglucosamine transferase (SPINDLY family)